MIHVQKDKVVISNNVILLDSNSEAAIKYDVDTEIKIEVTNNYFIHTKNLELYLSMFEAQGYWSKFKLAVKYILKKLPN